VADERERAATQVKVSAFCSFWWQKATISIAAPKKHRKKEKSCLNKEKWLSGKKMGGRLVLHYKPSSNWAPPPFDSENVSLYSSSSQLLSYRKIACYVNNNWTCRKYQRRGTGEDGRCRVKIVARMHEKARYRNAISISMLAQKSRTARRIDRGFSLMSRQGGWAGSYSGGDGGWATAT
jgi:hypothetical protein